MMGTGGSGQTGRGGRPRWSADILGATVVSVLVSLALGGWLALAVPGVGWWGWAMALAPVAFQLLDVSRSARRRRSERRRVEVEVSLQGADLGRADLAGRSLRRRDLSQARLVDADLTDADLAKADLTGARLHRADLTGATLARSTCDDAVFYRATLVKADLGGGTARNAGFEEANLRGANLAGADLRGAAFDGADARGANFSGATLDADALDDAIVDTTTILPDGRRGRATTAMRVGGGSALVGLVGWPLIRSLLLGVAGTTAVVGSGTAGLSGSIPGTVDVAARADRAEVDRAAALTEFGVADTEAAELDAAIGPDDTLIVDPVPPDPVTPDATAPEAGRGAAGIEITTATTPPPPARDEEEPTPQVLGVVVERGLHVVLVSSGGPSTATFDSPFGTATFTVDDEQQRLDFDGAPPGTFTVEMVPTDDHVVPTCALAIDAAQQTRRGGPGESIACELTVERDE